MLTAVYKSKKKADSFLFVEKRDDFTKVPEPLMAMFGQPKYVMLINLAKREVLGTARFRNRKSSIDRKRVLFTNTASARESVKPIAKRKRSRE